MKEHAIIVETTLNTELEVVKIRDARTGQLVFVGNTEDSLTFLSNYFVELKNQKENESK